MTAVLPWLCAVVGVLMLTVMTVAVVAYDPGPGRAS